MASPAAIRLPSGPVISHPANRMLRFCHEEYHYYDALPSGDPDRIEPLDVLATVAVNGFYNANSVTIRGIHRGLASACNPLLPAIPPDAELLTIDPSITDVATLLHAAIGVPRVLIPVATKVIHRKRPNLIPMLDNVVLAHYFGRLPPATQDKTRAAGVAMETLKRFRADLSAARAEVDAIVADLAAAGFLLTPVRVLEVLLWTEVEERGYYR
jgi:hypothetical protein